VPTPERRALQREQGFAHQIDTRAGGASGDGDDEAVPDLSCLCSSGIVIAPVRKWVL